MVVTVLAWTTSRRNRHFCDIQLGWTSIAQVERAMLWGRTVVLPPRTQTRGFSPSISRLRYCQRAHPQFVTSYEQPSDAVLGD